MTDKKLSREDLVRLFETQVRGTMAGCFRRARVVPTDEQWDLLTGKGPLPINVRDIGRMVHDTGARIEFLVSVDPDGGG